MPLPAGSWDPLRFTVLDARAGSQPDPRLRPLGPWRIVSAGGFQAKWQNYRLEEGTPPIHSRSITITNAGDEGLIVDTGAGRYHVVQNSGILGNVMGVDG